MNGLRVRYAIVIFLLVLTASVVHALQYDSSQDEAAGLAALSKIPERIDGWIGQDIPLDEKVYRILETRAILHRTYRDGNGNSILLSIVHYHDTKVDFHAPEACLGGLGERTRKSVKKLDLYVNGKEVPLEVAEIIATNPRSRSVSYYFYKTGNFIGQNYIQMRINLAKNKFLRRDTSGSLIRLSANYMNDAELAEKEKSLRALLEEILPVLIKVI